MFQQWFKKLLNLNRANHDKLTQHQLRFETIEDRLLLDGTVDNGQSVADDLALAGIDISGDSSQWSEIRSASVAADDVMISSSLSNIELQGFDLYDNNVVASNGDLLISEAFYYGVTRSLNLFQFDSINIGNESSQFEGQVIDRFSQGKQTSIALAESGLADISQVMQEGHRVDAVQRPDSGQAALATQANAATAEDNLSGERGRAQMLEVATNLRVDDASSRPQFSAAKVSKTNPEQSITDNNKNKSNIVVVNLTNIQQDPLSKKSLQSSSFKQVARQVSLNKTNQEPGNNLAEWYASESEIVSTRSVVPTGDLNDFDFGFENFSSEQLNPTSDMSKPISPQIAETHDHSALQWDYDAHQHRIDFYSFKQPWNLVSITVFMVAFQQYASWWITKNDPQTADIPADERKKERTPKGNS